MRILTSLFTTFSSKLHYLSQILLFICHHFYYNFAAIFVRLCYYYLLLLLPGFQCQSTYLHISCHYFLSVPPESIKKLGEERRYRPEIKTWFFINVFESKYSRMDHVKCVEDSLQKVLFGPFVNTSSYLKVCQISMTELFPENI